MSIPNRIWRVVRGRWLMAEERTRESRAEQDAGRELADSLNGPSGLRPSVASPTAASPRRAVGPSPRPLQDPLAADLALLGAPPACDMPTLDRVYAQRLAELQPEAFPHGSSERDERVSRRLAVTAAYERLRDAINTTETRFEKLEF